MTDPFFSTEELYRYNRHLIIPGFGHAAQARLKSAKVLVAGCGGLGSPLLLYLAAAGIGTIGLVDFDRVDESNLQRQVLFSADDVGERKVIAAKRRLSALNPFIQFIEYDVLLSRENVSGIIAEYDLVADGTDNFPTRYLINDACVLAGKPLVYAAVHQFEGQVAVFNVAGGPNYRDLHPTPPPEGVLQNCAEGGVLGVLPGIIGSLQALEVIKLISGVGEPLNGRLYIFDAFNFEGRSFKIRPNAANPLNAPGVDLQSLAGYDAHCLPGLMAIKELSPVEFEALRVSGEEFQLVDVREPAEYAVEHLGGALMPLSQLSAYFDAISRDKKVVVYCKSGLRSAQAIRLLQAQFAMENLYNLKGGIEGYLGR